MDEKTVLLNAAKRLVSHIEKDEILTAAWASRRVEELISQADTLAAYGFTLDSSDIMRPRLVKIEDPQHTYHPDDIATGIGLPCPHCHGITHHEDGCPTLAPEDRYPAKEI